MKHRSATENYGEANTFQDATRMYALIWRRKYGHRVPVPAVSHALSTMDDECVWTLACAETGDELAVIGYGMGVLSEDQNDEF